MDGWPVDLGTYPNLPDPDLHRAALAADEALKAHMDPLTVHVFQEKPPLRRGRPPAGAVPRSAETRQGVGRIVGSLPDLIGAAYGVRVSLDAMPEGVVLRSPGRLALLDLRPFVPREHAWLGVDEAGKIGVLGVTGFACQFVAGQVDLAGIEQDRAQAAPFLVE